jgi:hypothetical protein
MDRLPAYKGESRACPTAWGAVSTWTRCGERLAPRRDERARDIPQSHPRTLVSSAKPTTGIQVGRLPTLQV